RPGRGAALDERGGIALETGRLEKAEKPLQEALSRDPYERDTLFLLSRCYEQQGRKDQAAEVTARLARVDADLGRLKRLANEVAKTPQNAALRYEAGVICLRNGQDQEGLRWLFGAVGVDAEPAPTPQAFADYFQRTGHPDLAEQHRQQTSRQVKPGS